MGWLTGGSLHVISQMKVPDIQEFLVTSQKGQALSTVQNLNMPAFELHDLGVGDLDHDGSLDILALGSGDYRDIDPYLVKQGLDGGEAGPEFALDPPIGGGEAVGDFNRDGFADVALTGDGIQIFLNDGIGSFYTGENYPLGIYGPLLAREISGDGKVDLILVGANGVYILLGNGNGTFHAPKTYPSGACCSISIADFNKDGKLDLALGGGDTVSLLLNNGSGTFRSAVNYPAGGPVSAIAAISLQGNGNQSVLVADSKDNKLLLLAGDGKGNLAAPVYYYAGWGKCIGTHSLGFQWRRCVGCSGREPGNQQFHGSLQHRWHVHQVNKQQRQTTCWSIGDAYRNSRRQHRWHRNAERNRHFQERLDRARNGNP